MEREEQAMRNHPHAVQWVPRAIYMANLISLVYMKIRMFIVIYSCHANSIWVEANLMRPVDLAT